MGAVSVSIWFTLGLGSLSPVNWRIRRTLRNSSSDVDGGVFLNLMGVDELRKVRGGGGAEEVSMFVADIPD